MKRVLFALLLVCGAARSLLAQSPAKEPREFLPPPFDRYSERRVAELSSADWQRDITPETWPATQAKMRGQLQRMLGLDPWPLRELLLTLFTGGGGRQPLPRSSVCGHSNVIEDGVSLGNKNRLPASRYLVARIYVRLVLDTIQLGEIRGEHHGTYKLGRWWWPARGYTPAGVETWNAIRALDYLETRPDVDRTRIGMTGRSGGGAYTWWVAALDDRIKVAAPTAGITTLKNHILDGAIEGHCDCMFMVNTERWDFDRVPPSSPRAAAHREHRQGRIFPLDGVMEIYNHTRALYRRLARRRTSACKSPKVRIRTRSR